MNPARIAVIVFASVAAIGLAFLVHTMFAAPKAPPPVAAAAPAVKMTRVLVARVDLNIGDRLSSDNLTWQPWPEATVNASYIIDGPAAQTPPTPAAAAVTRAGTVVSDIATGGGPKLQSMVGAIVREPIYQGEPITERKLVRAGNSSFMAVRLPSGMRAVSLPFSAERGAGGFIQPGDRVDVLSTSGAAGTAQIVLTNALVLAIDQRTDPPKTGTGAPGSTITLQVPAASVGAVALARSRGDLTMALRSYADIKRNGPDADGEAVRLFKGSTPELVTVQ
jgi:pilus assembly protein CpaB